MKKLIALLLSLTLLLGVCACNQTTGNGNDLFQAASPSTSALCFFWAEKDSSLTGWIYDSAVIQEILSALSQVDAVLVDRWTPEKADYPVYGISIMDTEGYPIEAAWTNGYLILQDGSVYKFNYDFSKLKESYDWDDITERPYLPCQYYLARNGSQWYPKFLTPAEHEPAPENISLTVTAADNNQVTALLTNQGNEEWLYGEAYSLDVLLDGVWYSVPMEPSVNWGFTSIGYTLGAGSSKEKSYYLNMYGDLPSGTYRLVVEGLTAKFEI